MSNETNIIDGIFMESFEAYANDSKAVSELRTRLENARLVLEPVIKANKIPVGDNKAWKEKRALFYPIVKELEWPQDDDAIPGEEDKVEAKRAEARIAAWLGVIKTCLEYQILPTDKNADRLRKAKTWTGLNGNGKINPNWVDPKATAPTTTAPTTTAPTTTAPTTTQTIPEVASAKPVAAQKAAAKGDIPRPNISSTDEPLSPREHCTILLDQLFKNESFRSEFAPILATMLDSNVGIVTRCLVESRDLFCKGGK